MEILKGKGVCRGIAFGKVYYYRRNQQKVSRHHIEDASVEIDRFQNAKVRAIEQLESLYEKALPKVGEEGAQLFQIHQMMLEDEDYCSSIEGIISQQMVNAEYAVATTADNFARMFSEMDDPYMQGRAADVHDVSERVVRILQGEDTDGVSLKEPVIVVADDLAPSETVQLDKSKILAFATAGGSVNSHTAILSRTMGIPAIIGVGEALSEKWDGVQAIVDGQAGEIILQPDDQTQSAMQQKLQEELERKQLLEQLKGKPSVTLDGQNIMVYANIGNPSDIGSVLQNDANGIGLFRSEFLYLESKDYPTEEEQFNAYKSVVEMMAGKRVIIRTLDIGADKQADYFHLPKEENPAMGMRAIRICLTRPAVFKTQLRALYRASAFGKVAIMFPMITSVAEVRKIKEIVAEVKAELTADKIPFSDNVELGVMIETPAAAMISDRLAQEVDFFSIGTNDLTQYTLAVDRQNQELDQFCDIHHEAILRFIKMVADNAHKAGIWMGICGELGADLSLTETFLAMGVDELSVAPPQVLPLRKKIRETDVSKCKAELLEKLY